MQFIFTAILGKALKALPDTDRDGRTRVVLCDAPPILVLDAEQERSRFHLDNVSKIHYQTHFHTPRRLPDVLSPPPVERLKPDGQSEVTTYSMATPRPSNWPYHCALQQMNSNVPIEDRGCVSLLDVRKQFHDEAEAKLPVKSWLMAVVVDGHGGWQTSEYVARVLSQRLTKFLNDTPENYHTADSLSRQITQCFTKIDNEIRRKIEPAFDLGHSRVVRAGATTCCCLVSPTKIIAANIGDCKAVLCRSGKSVVLTDEHNAGNPEEARKLREAHPNEPDVVNERTSSTTPFQITDPNPNPLLRLATHLKLGDFNVVRGRRQLAYTKGRLQLTRAFGDFDLKDAKFAASWNTGRLSVKLPHSHPYISALPEITVMERDLVRDEFLVIASDGIWDELTPEEAVEIISKELKEGGDASKAAIKVQDAVLSRAAFKHGIPVDEILKMAPRQRRSIYDDLTVAIVCLDDRHAPKETN